MNDERPIEKLLRRYAKKRRDDAGAPVELHPATRRMLQGEVGRRFRKRTAAGGGEATTFAQVWQLWRKQLIWALPVLIVLGVGVWMLLGPSEKPGQEFDLAKNASAPAEMVESSFKALETTTPVTPAPAANLGDQRALAYANRIPARGEFESSGVAPKDESALKFENDRVAANGIAQAASADQSRGQTVVAKRALGDEITPFGGELTKTKSLSLSSPAKSDSLETFESVRKDYVAANTGRLASAPASSPAVIPSEAGARYYRQEARGSDRDKPQTYSQAFNNRAPAPGNGKLAKSSGITPVLVNFQVEQTGNQLRVIDGDGSTYLGEMELPAAGRAITVTSENKGATDLVSKNEPQFAAQQRMGAKLPQPQAAQIYFACRVAGTNRTLNQQVVFTWNFVGLTNEMAAAQTKAASGGGNNWQNNLPAQQFPGLNNSGISGRAQLGNAKEIEINAVPAAP